LHEVDPTAYPAQLDQKRTRLSELFAGLKAPDIEVFDSPTEHFRMRAEFRIWHEGDQSFYAMTPPGEKKPEPISDFAIGSVTMTKLMPPLLEAINQTEILRKKLYGCEFLTTLSGECLVTLIYHRPLDDQWHQQASQLTTDLGIDLIGRSKKQKIIIGKDFVIERLSVADREYRYQQVETGFTQPNARVNEKMLTWAQEVTKKSTGDLLELYCGNGNFTIPLSANFERVLATELSKISVRSALYNLDANGIENVTMVRMSSEEFTQALNGERPFRRLKDVDLQSYRFSTLFVDPPRAGLDDQTLELARRFDRILYISCNPETLQKNVTALQTSHGIKRLALFDQFPYTHHIESGVLLERQL
jgi:tRNA (uracil-5-)-methyltransferase